MINFLRFRNLREDNDISQEKMAKILKINRSTYSLWELGINIIPLKKLCEFADYFNLSLDYVLNLTNNRRNSNLVKGLNLKVLGNNMKKIRLNNNLSQDDIASILNVTQACIAKYEKGLICISTSNLYRFSKEFKISLNELCGKNEKK